MAVDAPALALMAMANSFNDTMKWRLRGLPKSSTGMQMKPRMGVLKKQPRGRVRRVSKSRRFMIDLMYFSNSIPLVGIERSMPFEKLAAARKNHPQQPPWSALFAKALGLAAQESVALRQAYFRIPFPYFYEYEESVVNIAHELNSGGEAGVLPIRIRAPDKLPLTAFRHKITEMSDADLWQRGFYRTVAVVGFLPFFLRRPLWWLAFNIPRYRKRFFGTIAITSMGALGADVTATKTPVTSLLTYGPLGNDGVLKVKLFFDHRVYDGATAARVLARLEALLLGPIYDELKQNTIS